MFLVFSLNVFAHQGVDHSSAKTKKIIPEKNKLQTDASAGYENQLKQALYLKIGIAVLVILAILYLIRLFSRRRKAAENLEAADDMALEELPPLSDTKELTPQEKAREEQRLEIEKLARAKPEDVAQLIKVWLSEE